MRALVIMYQITVLLAALVILAAAETDGNPSLNTLSAEQQELQNNTYNAGPTLALSTQCRLRPVDKELHGKVTFILMRRTKLIEYRVTVRNYDVNPLAINNTSNYKSHIWARVGSSHGQTILNLAFNYGILSIMTLSFGVENLDVEMEDIPNGCLRKLNETEKLAVTLDIMLRDLRENGSYIVSEGNNTVCHQVIKDVDGFAQFTDRCCYRKLAGHTTECFVDIPNYWLDVLDILLSCLTLGAFLFGPCAVPEWVYNVAVENTEYLVKLKESLYRTLVVCRSDRSEYDTKTNLSQRVSARHTLDLRNRKDFVKCRRIVSELPSNMVIPIKMSQFDILVNYHKLLPENRVPVGLTQCLSRALFLCKLRELESFTECCDSNVLGCVGKKNNPTKWADVCNLLGKILLLLFIPFPFYIRLAVYYLFENPEIEERQEAARHFGLPVSYNHRLMQHLTPLHPVYIMGYIMYFLVGLPVAYLSLQEGTNRFQRAITSSFGELKDLSWLSAGGILIKNIVWPFKRYGVFGIFIGLIWWPLVIPITFVVCFVYCIPLIFLTCRIILHTFTTSEKRSEFSKRMRTFDADALLKKLCSKRNTKKKEMICYCSISVLRRFIYKFVIISLCLLTIYSAMIIFAEVVSFIAEILCFTLMGLIVNASQVLKYGSLLFLVVIYGYDTYSNVNKKYLKLNKSLFSEIKGRLGKDIEAFTSLPSYLQGNRGFKTEEASDQAEYESTDDFSETKSYNMDINDLVLFIDSEDNPRISKQLFDDVCQIRVAGSPGPVYRSLLQATGKFCIILLFIVFVFIVVLSFGESHKVSSTNQVMATMAGGFMPLMFRHVIRPASANIETNLVSFRSKLAEIIKNFCQTWPMNDFIFDVEEEPEEEESDDGSEAGDNKKRKHGEKEKNGKGKNGKDKDEKKVIIPDTGDASGRRDHDQNDHQIIHGWNEFLNGLKSKVEDMDLKCAEGQCVDYLIYVQETDYDWLMEWSSMSDLQHETKINGDIVEV